MTETAVRNAAPEFASMLEAVTAGTTASPFAKLLGIECVEIEEDRALFRLPFRNDVTTVADIVHGGAVASLLDAAATAAAWATPHLPENAQGLTIALSLNYLDAARASDLLAEATVVRRGGSVVVIDVLARDASEKPVAKATATYKLSGRKA